MSDKLAEYRRANLPLPDHNQIWPLYGAGFEKLGCDGRPIEVRMPQFGPDELLVRHDAVGLCASDVKVVLAGESHPRIYRNMKANPVVLGHEVAMTVVGVGQDLRDRYRVGDRFIIQADIFVNGVGYAYGYEIQGGLSRYNVIDRRVLCGDEGNYLIPVQPSIGYAESAIIEPWACVIAAYRLEYRTGLKPGGTTWMIGAGSERPYTIGSGFDEGSHPRRLLLTDVPVGFERWLRSRAAEVGVEVVAVGDVDAGPGEQVDDVVLLGADADILEAVGPHLADFGVVAIVADRPLPRKVQVDVGRVHYNRWLYVGGTCPDVARAYDGVPVRSRLRPGGRAWFAGAGGGVGRMHVQRAIQIPEHPASILCTDVSDARLEYLVASFAAEAESKGIEFTCLNPRHVEAYEAGMARFGETGFDDIVFLVSAVAPEVLADAASYLAPGGVMNVFAGWPRGTMVGLDLSDVYLKGTRVIGHSASTIDELRLTLHQAEAGQLSPNRSVAAIGSLGAALEGLRAVRDAVFPGKVVIYPNIRDFPLTALPDLKARLPGVYAKLRNGREWTNEAEEEFLRSVLP